jgi:hypothetical protein
MAMTVPYMRTSPIHIPRRDLVLAAADSLYLRVTVVDSDDPCAQALENTGGIGGPSMQLIVWPDAPGFYDDYGMLLPVCGQILWSAAGVPSDALGAFDFAFLSGTMSLWPRRCGWAVQLNYDAQGAEVLLSGRLHVRPGGVPFTLPAPALLTDTSVPIHTDIEEPVLA